MSTKEEEPCEAAVPPASSRSTSGSESSSPAYGVTLPQVKEKNESADRDPESSISQQEPPTFGPALPPKVASTKAATTSAARILGPTLPPGFQREQDDSDSSSDDNFVGPLPPNKVSVTSLVLEQRALELKLSNLANANKPTCTIDEREEWMLIPPEMIIRSGITKTKFSNSKCERDRDQSAWTETPLDKRRKAEGQLNEKDQKRKLKDDAERMSVQKRDLEQERIAKKLKKDSKRDKSLLDLHTEKRKKEKDDKDEDQPRRPFNRETDLQLSKFNPKQVKSVIDKAKILDTRFSAGSNKYL